MIPLADENPVRRLPWVTIVLILACTAVYFGLQPSGRSLADFGAQPVLEEELEFALGQAAVPCELIRGRPLTEAEVEATFGEGDDAACDEPGDDDPFKPNKNVYLALLATMFLHGNLPHLFGNMLFLWVFGNNVEDRKGPLWYVVVYLLGGLAATGLHVALQPRSTVPMVGASGAIAAVMGAYVIWFPRARVKCMIPLIPFVLFRKVAAGWVLGLWFVSQFLLVGSNSPVAWAAHVGGFLFGAGVGVLWRRNRQSPPDWSPTAAAAAPLSR
jgi:membrane associated rhomboid family serine protease